MKGHFVNNGTSFELVTNDETQIQGSKIVGTLKIKNQKDLKIIIVAPFVTLIQATFKDVYAKKEESFKDVESIKLADQVELIPQQEIIFPFEINLDENCLITDKKQSHFLKYGQDAINTHLQLTITPHEIFLKISELIQNFHRFKLKEFKSYKKGKKTGVEFKYASPMTRDFAGVDSFLLVQTLDSQNLELDCTFNIRKLNLSMPQAPAEKQVKNVELKLPRSNLSFGKDQKGSPLLNQDFILKNLEEAISQVKIKGLA